MLYSGTFGGPVVLGSGQVSALGFLERLLSSINVARHTHRFSKGQQQRKVKAKSLLCFWAVREAGMSLRELAGRLEMSAPGVGYAVERGQMEGILPLASAYT